MGVATGAQAVQANVDVPAGIEDGPAQLVVVANGIASESCETTVVGGRPPARGRRRFRQIPSKPMAEQKAANATPRVLRDDRAKLPLRRLRFPLRVHLGRAAHVRRVRDDELRDVHEDPRRRLQQVHRAAGQRLQQVHADAGRRLQPVLHVVAVLLGLQRVGPGFEHRLRRMDVDLQRGLRRVDVGLVHRLRGLDVDRRHAL
jgi:hypothetical protein